MLGYFPCRPPIFLARCVNSRRGFAVRYSGGPTIRPAPGSAATQALLDRVRAGQPKAIDELFERHRPYLCRLVELRIDPRLRARVDASDVVQETQLEANRR